METFSLKSYVRDCWMQIGIGAIGLVLLAAMFFVLSIPRDAAIFCLCTIALCLLAMLGVGYLRRRHFYRKLAGLVERLDCMCHLTSLVDSPDFLEGRILWDVLGETSRAASDDAARYQQQLKAYRDYVELWIHEIKTPIAAANLMLSDVHGAAASKVKGELDRIESHVEQALYYARSTSFAHDYSIREILLTDVVREVCKKNARFLIEQGVAPVINLDNKTTVFADSGWLSFVLGQIVVNAAKYGATTIRFSLVEQLENTRVAKTVLEIADDGCGIPASDVPRVFDRGFVGANGRAQGSATGMGLYLVASLSEKMGIGVGLASEENVGTRVLLTFPHDRSRQDMAQG